MKTILVTGSTGFLGRHLVELLRQQEPEAKLRLLRRSESAPPQDPAWEIVQGDITSRQDVLRAAEGVEEIYHLAGLVEREPDDHWRQYTTHIEGARNVCEAVRQFGIKKAVHVSSSGTVAVSREPEERDESAAYTIEVVSQWPYYLSKIYAEKLVLWHCEYERLPIVVVNPSLLLGPGDDRKSSTGDIALFLEGQIKVIPSGGLNLVDVRDVAAGLVAAMQRGRPGERYLLGGVNLTFHEWIQRVSKLSGVPAPKFLVPVGVSLAGAKALRHLMPLAGKSFKLDDASIKMSALYWYCNPEKARRELGFQTRSATETLRDTIEYIRSHGAN
jgi:dihydroflavonol-4-reductase